MQYPPPVPDPLPVVVGTAGLTGRTPMVRRDDDPEREIDRSGEGGRAIPGSCLRVVSLPTGRVDCPPDCLGLQRDGSCLAEIVQAANAAGVAWRFEIDLDGYWVYAGPPLS